MDTTFMEFSVSRDFKSDLLLRLEVSIFHALKELICIF